ncbi:MAG: sensor histidine kinase [Cyclobacteriaceae bacterium]|nr:sensor histidine kinase [Cyclobacteriaceae bacterium]
MLSYSTQKGFYTAYGIIMSIGIFTATIRILHFPEYSGWMQAGIFFFSILFITFFWESLRGINRWLNVRLPFSKNLTLRMVVQLGLGLLFGLLIRSIIYLFIEPNVPIHIDTMFRTATWIIYALLPAGINLGFFTAFFIERWKSSLVEAERLEKEKAQIQFDNLKNQLNPHFLFNSLASLNSLILEDQPLATKFLQHLSKVYRYVLQYKERNTVPLKTELDFIRNYIFLLETRFRDALKIAIMITEADQERLIPPVTLQLLIENAIKHNVVDVNRPLQIDVLVSGNYLVVSNNIQLRTQVESSNRQGLDNLKSFFAYLTSQPVLIEKTNDRFSVKVPLL